MVILKPITNRREIKSYPLDSVPLANPWGSTGPGSGFTVEEHSNARNSDSSCIRGHGRLPGDRRCGSAAGIQRRSLNRFKAAQLIAASLASKFFRCAPGATSEFPGQVCGIPPPTPNLHRNVRVLPLHEPFALRSRPLRAASRASFCSAKSRQMKGINCASDSNLRPSLPSFRSLPVDPGRLPSYR